MPSASPGRRGAKRAFQRYASCPWWRRGLLCWLVKRTLRLPVEKRLADGSYSSTIYPSEKDRRHRRDGCVVRVIEYRLEGIEDAEPIYRLITTLLDPAQAPAPEFAALYHERWEIETAVGERRTH